jgi:hypothetical protein
MTIETIDKANVQKFVDVFSQRHSKLDFYEDQLEEKLLEFTEFFTRVDPVDSKKEYTKPYHFRLANHVEFKKFSITISRAMYSVPKVVMYMRMELRKYQQGEQSTMESITQPSMVINTGDQQQKESKLDRIKNIVKRETIDPNSPEVQMQGMIRDYQMIPKKWTNILHWYELGLRKREHLNSKASLQKLLENIIIAFNVFIEPNLVSIVHYSNEITKEKTETTAAEVLQAYLKVSQQNANKLPFGQQM